MKSDRERKDERDRKVKDSKRKSPTPVEDDKEFKPEEVSVEKKEPLSLEEFLAKKKAEEAAKSKVIEFYRHFCDSDDVSCRFSLSYLNLTMLLQRNTI